MNLWLAYGTFVFPTDSHVPRRSSYGAFEITTNAAYVEDWFWKAQYMQNAWGIFSVTTRLFRNPKIAVHHGIWREQHVAISRSSKKKNKNDDNLKWGFPLRINGSDHCEWTFRRLMDHLGLFTETAGATQRPEISLDKTLPNTISRCVETQW